MYNLDVKYSNNMTSFECEDFGLMARLSLVLGEYGYSITAKDGSITVDEMIPYEEIKELIREQFNPNIINVEIVE